MLQPESFMKIIAFRMADRMSFGEFQVIRSRSARLNSNGNIFYLEQTIKLEKNQQKANELIDAINLPR